MSSERMEKQSVYQFPSMDLLDTVEEIQQSLFDKDVIKQGKRLERTLTDFRVNAKVVGVSRGPSVTRFEVEPSAGIKESSVINLADDIALRLAVPGVRMDGPVFGKTAIGIEVPNVKRETVSFREMMDCKGFRDNSSPLCIGLGKVIGGKVILMELSKMPHLLVAGDDGSGKTSFLNTVLAGIMYKARPDEVKLILADTEMKGLTNYNGIPHLLVPVITDTKKAASALRWAVEEMERRCEAMKAKDVWDINEYNTVAEEKMPYIVIVIDEMYDLMMAARDDVEELVLRLGQKGRACGIHMVLATRHPSADVMNGAVSKSIPSRIAFAVSTSKDSQKIMGMNDAIQLLGKGDMLYYPIGASRPVRVQGAFISEEALRRVTGFIRRQGIF